MLYFNCKTQGVYLQKLHNLLSKILLNQILLNNLLRMNICPYHHIAYNLIIFCKARESL